MNRFKWKIYKRPDQDNLLNSTNSITYERTGFADSLKLEASEEYNVPTFISDQDKDIKQFTHPKTLEIVSARDIYIEWGVIRRSQDLDYWCKKALTPYISPRESPTICVVTDWRFPNESQYAIQTFDNVKTFRLYRSDIPEPPANIESEHSLDTYSTDYLLLQENEFEQAIKKFPQYTSYVPCGYI